MKLFYQLVSTKHLIQKSIESTQLPQKMVRNESQTLKNMGKTNIFYYVDLAIANNARSFSNIIQY